MTLDERINHICGAHMQALRQSVQKAFDDQALKLRVAEVDIQALRTAVMLLTRELYQTDLGMIDRMRYYIDEYRLRSTSAASESEDDTISSRLAADSAAFILWLAEATDPGASPPRPKFQVIDGGKD